MIVPDETERKPAEGPEIKTPSKDEPPPTYSPPHPPAARTDSDPQQPSQSSPQPQDNHATLPKIKPCNYLSLTREVNSVKGVFVLDPTLRIPSSFLPPLEIGETEQDRKNLKLVSSHGTVDVNIFLLAGKPPESVETGTPRTTILVGSYNGNVTARLRVHSSGTTERAPYHFQVSSTNSNLTVHIPRDFHGVLTLATRSNSVLSRELSAHTTVFSEVDNVRRCFIGDLSMWGDSGDWTGDEITAETQNGRVKVQFVDESVKSKGFLGRVLGL